MLRHIEEDVDTLVSGRGRGLACSFDHLSHLAKLGGLHSPARDAGKVGKEFLDAAGGLVDVGRKTLHFDWRKFEVDQHLGATVDCSELVAKVVNDGGGEAADGRDALLPDQVGACRL